MANGDDLLLDPDDGQEEESRRRSDFDDRVRSARDQRDKTLTEASARPGLAYVGRDDEYGTAMAEAPAGAAVREDVPLERARPPRDYERETHLQLVLEGEAPTHAQPPSLCDEDPHTGSDVYTGDVYTGADVRAQYGALPGSKRVGVLSRFRKRVGEGPNGSEGRWLFFLLSHHGSVTPLLSGYWNLERLAQTRDTLVECFSSSSSPQTRTIESGRRR